MAVLHGLGRRAAELAQHLFLSCSSLSPCRLQPRSKLLPSLVSNGVSLCRPRSRLLLSSSSSSLALRLGVSSLLGPPRLPRRCSCRTQGVPYLAQPVRGPHERNLVRPTLVRPLLAPLAPLLLTSNESQPSPLHGQLDALPCNQSPGFQPLAYAIPLASHLRSSPSQSHSSSPRSRSSSRQSPPPCGTPSSTRTQSLASTAVSEALALAATASTRSIRSDGPLMRLCWLAPACERKLM